MVTAGVYLIARCSPIYDVTADGSLVVAIIGTITCWSAASAVAPRTTSRRCWPTRRLSQIGYMFLAVGLGAGVYALGILLLLCHGFFKAGCSWAPARSCTR